MVKQEIVAGLRNAIERGTDLERAKYSFISAGYPPEEVEEAARSVRESSVFPQEQAFPIRAYPQTIEKPVKTIRPVNPIEGSIKAKIRKNLKIILLIIILAVLTGVLTLTVLFRETITGWFG